MCFLGACFILLADRLLFFRNILKGTVYKVNVKCCLRVPPGKEIVGLGGQPVVAACSPVVRAFFFPGHLHLPNPVITSSVVPASPQCYRRVSQDSVADALLGLGAAETAGGPSCSLLRSFPELKVGVV